MEPQISTASKTSSHTPSSVCLMEAGVGSSANCCATCARCALFTYAHTDGSESHKKLSAFTNVLRWFFDTLWMKEITTHTPATLSNAEFGQKSAGCLQQGNTTTLGRCNLSSSKSATFIIFWLEREINPYLFLSCVTRGKRTRFSIDFLYSVFFF